MQRSISKGLKAGVIALLLALFCLPWAVAQAEEAPGLVYEGEQPLYVLQDSGDAVEVQDGFDQALQGQQAQSKSDELATVFDGETPAATSKLRATAEQTPSITYRTHVQTYGWKDWSKDGAKNGTTNEGKRMEAIQIKVEGDPNLRVAYMAHVQRQGWQDPVVDGATAGTRGEGLRLEAIAMVLGGSNSSKYDIYYRVHAQHFGWMDWAKNGDVAGTSGYGYRLEAIQIKIVPKGSAAPGKTDMPYRDGKYGNGFINYKTHVQKQGWQDWVWDGDKSGTSGKSLRLEGVRINTEHVDNLGVTYRTYVQKQGWQAWKKDGEVSGTSGQSLRLEGIQIKLTGSEASNYDVFYRVHCEQYGWLNWAMNGEMAGTSRHSYRLESIQVVLAPKGEISKADLGDYPSSVEGYSTDEGNVMKLVNKYRKQAGLVLLTGDAKVHKAAEVRAKELHRKFDHTRPNGTSCFTALDEAGANYYMSGENIALGFTTPASVVNGWMNSPGHRANILQEDFRYMGVGENKTGWAQMFTA